MSAVWIAAGVAVVAVIAVAIASWRRRQYVADLGTVSTQWMAEQRLHAQHDSQR
jgi:heme exporter protein D